MTLAGTSREKGITMSKSEHRLSIDFDTADKIVILSLKDQIKCLSKENKLLKKKKILKDSEAHELGYNMEFIACAEYIIKYYGG